MTTYIVFIPFPLSEATEFIEKTNQWNQANKKKVRNFRIICYTPGASWGVLGALKAGDQIYIRGHGKPGSLYFEANHGDNPPKVTVEQGCQRLIDMGLTKSFAGKVKFYNCNSGTTPTGSALKSHQTYYSGKQGLPPPNFDGTPMAKKGATYFRKKGFKKCKFYGYQGMLASEFENRADLDGDNFDHKHISFHSSLVPIYNQTEARASQGRVEF